MKNLPIMIKKSKEDKKDAQRFDKLPRIIGCLILAVCLIPIYTCILFHQDKVYTIDDKSYTYSLMNQVIPIKIELIDSVWGSAMIDSVEEAAAYYEMIQNLPISLSTDEEEKYENTVRGTISFVEGDNIDFTAGTYISIDGVMYGDDYTRLSIKSHTNRLCKWLFTPDNLANLIGSHNRVVLRQENKRMNLSVDQKMGLREALLAGTLIADNEKLSHAIRTKGKSVAQVEIYVLDSEEKMPKVYMVFFENGLCAVHDDRFVGTIMYLDAHALDGENLYHKYDLPQVQKPEEQRSLQREQENQVNNPLSR